MGQCNQAAYALSRSMPRDWQIHKQVDLIIWNTYGSTEVNLLLNMVHIQGRNRCFWDRIRWCRIGYIYRCCSTAVIVMDDTAPHLSEQCFDSPFLSKQAIVPPVIDITDWSSVLTAHKTRPAVPDDWVTVAQQTTHLQIMGLAPMSNASILLLNVFLSWNVSVQKQAKGKTLPFPMKNIINQRIFHFKYICFRP